MNYRHLYHAGGFADVFKHIVLSLVLARLAAKETPFCVLDTHAGIGRYDLQLPEAQKTGEYRQGIGRLLPVPDAPPELSPYLDLIRSLNPDGGLRWYPGSPLLEQRLTRPQDRLVLMELHPEDARDLRRRFADDPRIGVHHQDGYLGLKAFLPPKERRGLVLIDPPYEARDELAQAATALQAAHRRWPTGVYLLWYPIKDRPPIRRFHAGLKAAPVPKMLAVELLVQADDSPERLNGSGLILVNPPWQLDRTLKSLLPWLGDKLQQAKGARTELRWLRPE